MLPELKHKKLQELTESLTKEELIWVNGYLNGLVAKNLSASTLQATHSVNKITIAYGTETGNSKKVAAEFAAKAKKNGIIPKLISLDQYRFTDLIKEEYFLTIISTQGEGEPPVAAQKFYDHIHLNGFKLDKMKYSVLALGDTSYPLYCKAGEDVDVQLNKLGGNRIFPVQKCDVDYETEANEWFDKILHSLKANNSGSQAVTVLPAEIKKPAGKKISYAGTIIANINLNDKGSNKQTHHIEIAAESVEYLPGDSLGIYPKNQAREVEEIISITCGYANKTFEYKTERYNIFHLLQNKVSIFQVTDKVVKKYAEITAHNIPVGKINLLELLKKYPVKDDVQFAEVLQNLNPVSPRLYTIASSPNAHDGEIHLTVEKDKFVVNDEVRFGVCSTYLSQLPANTELNFFVQPNKRFRLPAEDKDVIMIGYTTGVAAYRSFLAERDATGASGRNWLFFGSEKFESDFLYQTEIQNWKDTGVLTKVNVAFSKDAGNLFVHDKLLQHANELYEWIHAGAYIYICGEKHLMSLEVEEALLKIIEHHGKKTPELAKEYLNVLKEEGRYEKDVY
jgi:sulfite reductase (NADPH) flavoprotein alpha-component